MIAPSLLKPWTIEIFMEVSLAASSTRLTLSIVNAASLAVSRALAAKTTFAAFSPMAVLAVRISVS